jgi:hypothetical protein
MTGSDRRSRLATSILAALIGAAAWLSAGTVAYSSGGADRVAALPPLSYLLAAMVVTIVAVRMARLRLDEGRGAVIVCLQRRSRRRTPAIRQRRCPRPRGLV